MNICTVVKNRILFLCEKNGITVCKLASESGIPHSTLKSILYGKSKNPGIVTIKILCDGLVISITEFFNTPEFKNLEQEIK